MSSGYNEYEWDNSSTAHMDAEYADFRTNSLDRPEISQNLRDVFEMYAQSTEICTDSCYSGCCAEVMMRDDRAYGTNLEQTDFYCIDPDL